MVVAEEALEWEEEKKKKKKRRGLAEDCNAEKFWRMTGVEMGEDCCVVAGKRGSSVMKVVHVGFLGLNEREGGKGYLGFLMGKKDLGPVFENEGFCYE